MYHIFIDTNVFLSYYRDSAGNTEEFARVLSKFSENSENYKVYVNNYLKDEILRNRASVLSQKKEEFSKNFSLPKSFPSIFRLLENFNQFEKDTITSEKSFQKLIKEYMEKANQNLFEQDRFIESFFSIYTPNPITNAHKGNARERLDFGYPPGKKGSYGDALNWSYLLTEVPQDSNLYVVSKDNDFSNPLNKSEINPYLAQEWKRVKNGDIIFLDSISSLINILDKADSDFEQSYISEQLEKLINSTNFSDTHDQVEKLKSFVDKFNKEQIISFLTGFYRNAQINWISEDVDIKDFISLIESNPYYSTELRQTIKTETLESNN